MDNSIIKSDCNNTNEVMVSVICNTYNQAKYIRKTLDGFIMQETNFVFEVLVHDDASTDGTDEIVKEYEKKYPHIIKGCYETENQYSKHNGSIARIQIARVKGKYLAFCEGDDYWIDKNKLQKQFDFLENNKDYSLCATKSITINDITGEEIALFADSNEDRTIPVEEIIEENNGRLFQLASVLIKSEIYTKPPAWRVFFPIGDYPLFINSGILGKIMYFSEASCVYRRYSSGSWTNATLGNKNTNAEFIKKMMNAMTKLNEYTDFNYEKSISKVIDRLGFSLSRVELKNKDITIKKYKHLYNPIYIIRIKIVIFIETHFPSLYSRLKKK